MPFACCKDRWKFTVAVCAGAMTLLAGCATPARPELDAFTEEPIQQPFNGAYVATFHTRWFGPIYARLTAERTAAGFKANTEPGVAWGLVGGIEQVLGQLLAPFIFPKGMLLVWDSTLPDPAHGVVGEGTIGPGTIDAWRLTTRMESENGPAVIRYRDGRAVAVVTLERESERPIPPTDYPLLSERLEAAVREHSYDRSAATSGEMAQFFEDVRLAAPRVHDDLTYLSAIALAWRKRGDVALPIPYREPIAESERLLSAAQNPVAPLTLTFSEQTGIATVEGVVFRDAGQVESVMNDAIARQPRAIIIDLRNCTGLDLSALGVVSALVRDEVDAGWFMSGARRDELTRDRSEIHADTVVLTSPSDAASADRVLDATGGVHLIVRPARNVFDGPVAVLTSSRTRSSGELIAYLLQSAGRAKVVGERPAGRVRLSRERDLGQGFLVRLDEFDWRPSREEAPLHTGLKPDVQTSRQKAPARAESLLGSARKDGRNAENAPG